MAAEGKDRPIRGKGLAISPEQLDLAARHHAGRLIEGEGHLAETDGEAE